MELIEIKSVTAGEAVIEYINFGNPAGRPFVILPGLSVRSVLLSANSIAAAYKIFAREFSVYLFDRRKNLPETYCMREMAEDTAAAMRELGISGADIFGVSQGGIMAQYIAAYHPDLVHKLVLGSTTWCLSEETKSLMRRLTRLAGEGKGVELNESFAEYVYTPGFMAKYGPVIAEMGKLTEPEDFARFMILAGMLGGADTSAELGMIHCPALVIGARNDRLTGCEASEKLAELLGCELYIYEDYGHAVYDEAPDYKQRMYDFLKKD